MGQLTGLLSGGVTTQKDSNVYIYLLLTIDFCLFSYIVSFLLVPTTLPPVRARRIQFFFKEDFQSVVLDNYKSMDSFILNTFLEPKAG